MVANILPTPAPPDPGAQKVNIPLSGYGHIAYQIKGNQVFCNMVANILPSAPPPSPDPGSKS